MTVSVITPSVRPEGLNILAKCLKRQTYRDNEWLVCAPSALGDKIHKDAKFIPEPPLNKGDVWGFNKAMNALIKEAKGELIVSIQDFIWFPPDALEKFVFHYKDLGACVSGVGHIYSPEIDVMGKPYNRVWTDPRIREDHGSIYECFPQDVEFNFCAIPKQAFYDIGGMDETMDQKFGMDNVDAVFRMDKVGYKFYLDQTNECRGIKHGRPEGWDEKHWMHTFNDRKTKTKLDFL